MFRQRAHHTAQGHPVVKCCQCAAVAYGQRQQVGVCDLVMSHDARPIQNLVTSQAQIARPKFMIGVATGKIQFFPDGIKTRRRAFGVAG